MFRTPERRLFFILLLSIAALMIALPGKIQIADRSFTRAPIDIQVGNIKIFRDLDIKRGLDLVGGSHLVFEADTASVSGTTKDQALDSLESVIAQRVNLFGVSEAVIQKASFEGKDRIIVELPGIQDTSQAIALIGQTAQLVFAEVLEPTEEGAEPELIPSELTGADVKNAEVIFDEVTGAPAVGIEFTDAGAKKFEALTERNVGKNIPIMLDNMIISAPLVSEKIVGNSAQISGLGGEEALERARLMTTQINAGALPLPVSLIEERTIGPTLGEQSIEMSIRAGLVGIVAVLIFMAVLYKRLGLIADLGLILFGVFTLAVYKLIPVVLTLPGIAGFLLSVGMAVDSNILIFERYREERAKGASVEFALETAFGRAWDSIRDANIATLVTAFILANPFSWSFLHTSGPVRGFAVTLALGILLSLFTGVFISRNLLRYFMAKK